jgi:ABC-type multidrug transport system ATPase subunit
LLPKQPSRTRSDATKIPKNLNGVTVPQTASILQANGLSFCFPDAPDKPLFVQLSLDLPPGVTLLCGDEGSGKTTLLQLLAGALLSTAGRLQIKGVGLAENRLAYQQQLTWLDPRDSALNEQTAVHIFNTLAQRQSGFSPDLLQAHIAGLSLEPHLHKALYMLSTGTRRKVLLAAALAAQAAVTLLDQPFMALDRPSIAYLLDLLAGAARQPDHAWLVADYAAPAGVTLASVIELGV